MAPAKVWTCCVIALFMMGCRAGASTSTSAPTADPPTRGAPSPVTADPAPQATAPPTVSPTPSEVVPTDISTDFDAHHYPNLWTQIDKSKVTLYPFDYMLDYTYDRDGALWIAGSFGVVRRGLDNRQTWYSIKNGLPKNAFSTIAIDPNGDVWVGGADNALFRFDGHQWIDEGDRLPPPYDDRTHYVCYSNTIMAIDFGPDGTVWIVNAGLEVYRRVFGQWINVPFPKQDLPGAGGGACPEGIRVRAEDDIVIKIGPC